jgi:Tol biopolymer transport system component
MKPIHARAPRSSPPNGRTRWRHVATTLLGAAGCVVAAACHDVEPTATPASVRKLAAEADVVTAAKPEQPGQSSLIAYVSGRAGITDLYIMDVANGRSHRVTRDRAGTGSPVWSPDGTRIAFASNRDALGFNIWAVPATGGTPVKYTHSGADMSPDWSADGGKIAFGSHRDSNGEIYVMNADGTGQTRLTSTTDASEQEPVWSPNGSKIAYTSHRAGAAHIWVMNADGTGQVQLTSLADGTTNLSPAWSPDGTKIAFTSFRAGRQDLYVMNADGTNQTRITETTNVSENAPHWSVQGIVFTAYPSGTPTLFRINPDGTGLTQLSRGGTPSYDAAWKP